MMAFLNNPFIIALLFVVTMVLLKLAGSGKVQSISKDGIVFADEARDAFKELQKQIDERFDKVHKQMDIDRKKSNANDLEIKKGLLRLQILSDATNVETKLKLYDEYKKIGGNSYIDLYINKIKEEV